MQPSCPATDTLTQSQSNALNIHFGLLRLEGRFLLFTLLPDNTGGVKRARALVHSRAVGTKLLHQASLTIARPSDLTINAVRSKLKLDTGSAASSLPPSPNPQMSAGTSVPSPYLQPSPLRSHFPASQIHTSANDAPPPPPDKDSHTLYKMRSNNSLRTPQLATPPFSPPVRQSSREANGSTSPNHGQNSPPMHNGTSSAGMRQVSNASTSSATSPASVGLGLGNSFSSPYAAASIPHSSSNHTNASISPRLAYSDFEREQREGLLGNGHSSPNTAHMPAANTQVSPRSNSPAASVSSRTSGNNGQRPQDLPLPLSASPSMPTSARSLEASTLDSMFRPSESYESLDDEVVARRLSPASSAEQAERIAVAEAIARAAEAKWHADQERESMENPVTSQQISDSDPIQGSSDERVLDRGMEASQLSHGKQAYSASEEEQKKDTLRAQAEAELVRLEQEARNRATAHEHAEQERKKAEWQQKEAEVQAERQRIEAEAELKRVKAEEEAETQRQRTEAETEAKRQREDAERKRQEAEAEAERKRQEAVAEAERERREAEAAAEAERIRVEEEKIAQEKARLQAIEDAKRKREEARAQARDGVRQRISSTPGEVALTGFLSVQGGSSIVSGFYSHLFDSFSDNDCTENQLWRRRYFQMTGQTLKLYKNDTELASPMDEIALTNNLKRIDESAEDLMAIPHSFKMVFNDYDEEPYLFYCDEQVGLDQLYRVLEVPGLLTSCPPKQQDDKDLLVFGLRTAAKLM